jgi:hypothetical protein
MRPVGMSEIWSVMLKVPPFSPPLYLATGPHRTQWRIIIFDCGVHDVLLSGSLINKIPSGKSDTSLSVAPITLRGGRREFSSLLPPNLSIQPLRLPNNHWMQPTITIGLEVHGSAPNCCKELCRPALLCFSSCATPTCIQFNPATVFLTLSSLI